ncbi:glycoside hydrolase family 52 protein [Parasphaerochaeta coccoides]|uniref:Xylan 1,4-beta-xylosidase n=1 Tax=Parasphaerochaeta coccoides (strain ATCC BAA-1237 / DSM 17374 / SPN1) TaxID=760011 RepID=F4GLI0_PARC1|nr:glycoside hydrolase family 52 protein [Parasphaerochaeta coccoides]AEC01950.1 Xylan 1,4-beta-xylosidase [Parasphaerochaeta coccoides DSM 17374]
MDTCVQQKNAKDHYAQHGMWGAYSSFVIGRANNGGGFVTGDVQPPGRNVYMGYKLGNEEPVLLPFVTERNEGLDSTAYKDDSTHDTDESTPKQMRMRRFTTFPMEQVERTTTLGGETWHAGILTVSIRSFFGPVPDPATTSMEDFRLSACPALLVEFCLDNTDGQDEAVGYFGLQGIRRPLSDATDGRLSGMAAGVKYGFATFPEDNVVEIMDWKSVDAAFNESLQLRRLAREGGLRFHVPPGVKRTFTIALGVYEDGVVTTGLPMRRYYTALFKDLEEVLEFALENKIQMLARSVAMDELLDSSPLTEMQKIIVAASTHAYCANTELLLDDTGAPVFVVNEGEYQMMNTLDLTVDQAFYELIFSPWTVRNELDFLQRQSLYRDAYGIAFSHDQGGADCFTPQGRSVYELSGLVDCFSYMSYEETLNWMLTACLYSYNANDTVWAADNKKVLILAMDSLIARDANGDGIMDVDSDLCEGGAEITTYDSLDISLGQARNNLYLAVKAWGAFVSISSFFERAGDKENSLRAQDAAKKISRTVSACFIEDEKFIPAVFEGGNRSRIIPAVEGMIYPFFTGASPVVLPDGPYGEFISLLRTHLLTVLKPGICLDSISGGWKLSSTSRNTWLSKIFLNQFIAEQILELPQELIRRDEHHWKWQFTGSAGTGMTDQVDSSTGRDMGSRFYPRLVTSILWLVPCGLFTGLKMPKHHER